MSSWTREDATALMDGRYRLSYVGPGVGGKLSDRALTWDRFADAKRAAKLAAGLRPEWVIFVLQGGRIVWASDERPVAHAPEDF